MLRSRVLLDAGFLHACACKSDVAAGRNAGNSVGDDGASAIMESLKSNTRLTALNLRSVSHVTGRARLLTSAAIARVQGTASRPHTCRRY